MLYVICYMLYVICYMVYDIWYTLHGIWYTLGDEICYYILLNVIIWYYIVPCQAQESSYTIICDYMLYDKLYLFSVLNLNPKWVHGRVKSHHFEQFLAY